MPHPTDVVVAKTNVVVAAALTMPRVKIDLDNVASQLGWDRSRTQAALRELGIR